MIICTLAKDINSCQYYDANSELCSNTNTCSFQYTLDIDQSQTKYVRKKRWYEKYYERGRRVRN